VQTDAWAPPFLLIVGTATPRISGANPEFELKEVIQNSGFIAETLFQSIVRAITIDVGSM
jgi:hypothetical protein